MDIHFDNRVAVITGSGRGLGKSYALELSRRGVKIVANDCGTTDKGVKSADEVVELIKDSGGEAIADYNDIASAESARNVIDTALDNYGKVDILINNAGVLRDKSFAKMSSEEIDLVLKIHLHGAFYMTKAVFPVMKDNAYGRVIFTTSSTGLYGNFGQTNYGAAKLGLVGLMLSLKAEAERSNILVNTISPLALTRIIEGVFPEEFYPRLKSEYVTALVTYLCSDTCSVSGKVIAAGCGYYAIEQIHRGKGYAFQEEEVSAEMIADRIGEIVELKELKSFDNAVAANENLFSKIRLT